MSTAQKCAPLNKNKISKPLCEPSKKVLTKDHIVSSNFAKVKQFTPSYATTKPEINSLLTMEYAKMWENEYKLYAKNVIEETKKVKKKVFGPPSLRSNCSKSVATSSDVTPLKSLIRKKNNIPNAKPKPIWK